MMRWSLAIPLALTLLISQPSRGALVVRDLATPGDGLITFDTETGFEWLDLTATEDQAATVVASGYYRLQLGFEWASGAEVLELWAHGGVVEAQGSDPGNAPGVGQLVTLLGATLPPDKAHGQHEGGFTSKIRSRLEAPDTALFQTDPIHTTLAAPGVGHYLRRPGAEPDCSDGADNDGDGLADFPDDPGCTSAADDLERDVALACDDGLDNDGDGELDFHPDPGLGDPECDCVADTTEDGSSGCLLVRDLATPGDGLITFDTETGLEWLDLTVTEGQAATAVAGGYHRLQLGFEWASGAEVLELWAHGGVVETAGSDPGNAPGVGQLVALLGATLPPDKAHGQHEGGFTSKIRSRLEAPQTALFQTDPIHTTLAAPGVGHYLRRPGAEPDCSDGADNDGDGFADFPDDPGCSAAWDDLEKDPLLACDNGLDDDGDGAIDHDPDVGEGDPQCTAPDAPREGRRPRCGLGFEVVLVLVALRRLRPGGR